MQVCELPRPAVPPSRVLPGSALNRPAANLYTRIQSLATQLNHPSVANIAAESFDAVAQSASSRGRKHYRFRTVRYHKRRVRPEARDDEGKRSSATVYR